LAVDVRPPRPLEVQYAIRILNGAVRDRRGGRRGEEELGRSDLMKEKEGGGGERKGRPGDQGHKETGRRETRGSGGSGCCGGGGGGGDNL
jgi:hypothetical protein